jgi:ribosomal protein L31
VREKRRGWERGLYGVRGNEVEKEEGDLKRSRGGGSESSALDRTKVRSSALGQNCVVRARSALWACSVALCARAYMNAIAYAIEPTEIRSIAGCRDVQKRKIKINKKHHKFYTNKHRIYTDKNNIKQLNK